MCKSSYIPSQCVSVDESMINFQGTCRLSFLQYLPKKPKKWGMKAWVLADNGYTWNWDLTGKSDAPKIFSLICLTSATIYTSTISTCVECYLKKGVEVVAQ